MPFKERNSFDFYKDLIDKKIKIPYNLFVFNAKEIINLSLFAKKISAIANSGGGYIVVGMNKKNNIATEFDPIKDINFDEEFFFYEIHSYLSPEIINMKIDFYNISDNNTIISITIPQYNNQLHMFSDNRFYTWKNNKLHIMEEAEIRAGYGLARNSELEILGIINTNGLPIFNNGIIDNISFYPKIFIKNIGNKIEKLFKIEFSFPSSLYDENFQPTNSAFVRYEGKNSVFNITGNTPLFQNEISAAIEFKIFVSKNNFDDFNNGILTVTLFYENGTKEQKYYLSELFTYNGTTIQKNNFLPKQNSLYL